MSPDTQVALARHPPRPECSHLSRAARQVVPPFLQKLYEIVNDPANEELIKWSETGDSFFVLNHEKFAREVLGRWFKHQKFASFVRQLNMYGFHKIPHLQQGVLKSDSDTEPWHFEHPHFHRGQPDLLCLIQRKKQPNHGQPEDATSDFHDPANATIPIANVTPPGQLMDINSIVNGVSAIKRHQQAISSDLSNLKQANDALWKEAVASRQRHAKHQDTINRILKFLAGVFGHTDSGSHSPDGSHSPPQVTPHIPHRLMIGPATKGKPVDIMEVEDDEADRPHRNRSRTPFASDPYATIETPETTASTPSVVDSAALTEPFSPITEVPPDSSDSPPLLPSQILSRTNSSNTTPRLTNGSTAHSAPALPPTPPTPNSNNVDAMWQAAIQHMMSSPGQLQKIMQAFANQQPIPSLSPSPDIPLPPSTNSTVATYDPSPAWFTPSVPSSSSPTSQPLLAPVNTDDNSTLQLLLDESHRLQKSYRDAADIDADMDMLQSSINSLIQNLGIDPSSLAPTPEDAIPPPSLAPPPHMSHALPGMNGASTGTTTGTATGTHGFDAFSHEGLNALDGSADVSHPDFLLDSLLSQIGDGTGHGGGDGGIACDGIGGLDYPDITDHYDHSARIDGTAIEDASTEQLTAFLDEASASASAGAGGVDARSPRVGTGGTGGTVHQKRKSEVADLDLDLDLGLALPTSSSEGGAGKKTKRKR